MTSIRTGIDILEISRFAEMQPSIRQRFLKRVFTDNELVEIGDSDASLAGRFAAKEAVAKALGCGIGGVNWRDIEVRRGLDGAPLLELHGEALRLAGDLDLAQWSISISHSQTHAVAVAVALGETTS